MYSGHSRLCACLSLAAFPHYCTGPGCNLGEWKGVSSSLQYWADLQSVHGFRSHDNTAPNAKRQQVLVVALWLVRFIGAHLFLLR